MFPLLTVVLFFSLGIGRTECFVQEREVIRAVYGVGHIESRVQVLVSSPVSGQVRRVYASEGDRIRKGQKLADIDSGGLEDRINSLEARIRKLRDKLSPHSPFREKMESLIRMRKEDLQKAESRYARRLRLYQKGVISREELEEAQRQLILAREALRSSLSEKESILKDIQHELSALISERESLSKELKKYRISSPINGKVLKVFVREGEFVNHIGANNRLFLLGSEEKIAILRIDEEYAPLVKRNQKVYIVLDAYPDRVFEGKVKSYELWSDPLRRTVNVEVNVSLPEDVPSGTLVEGNIVVERFSTTVVPAEAVKSGYVLLRIGEELKKVKTGSSYGEFVEVKGYPPGTPCLLER